MKTAVSLATHKILLTEDGTEETRFKVWQEWPVATQTLTSFVGRKEDGSSHFRDIISY